MIPISHSARRAALLLIAFATAAAGWEASALAGEREFWASHNGAQSSSDQFMVIFEFEAAYPMPHWVLDTDIDPLYLQWDHSQLLYGIYYANWYTGTRAGFVSGVKYKAKLYWYDPVTQEFDYQQGKDDIWTEP
jgi:hypothetical protein